MLRDGQELSCVAAGLGRSRSGGASLHDGQGVDDLGPRGFGGVGKCALECRVTNSRRRVVDDLGSRGFGWLAKSRGVFSGGGVV